MIEDFLTLPDTLPEIAAAVDLGSNSFHMIVTRLMEGGSLQVIDRMREQVRLGEGLTEDKSLHPVVVSRALACLERFGQRLREMPPGSVRAVGTNTLRQVRPDSPFLTQAEQALGHSIEVINGREEARLVYLGVSHGVASSERRLVVDIGGGSTELIVGQGFEPSLRESLHMGCISITQHFFPQGLLTARTLEQAELACAVELRPVRETFRQAGWQQVVGSSGTARAIATVLRAEGWSDDVISLAGLRKLRHAMIEAGRLEALQLKELSEERKSVFPGGVAVLSAIFKHLRIERMQVSDQALREGLIYDLLGRIQHEDVRERTLRTLIALYRLDTGHAGRVEETAKNLLAQVASSWHLNNPEFARLLGWAAQIHEVGLLVSHTQYHKHGAYLIRNADLPGFSREEQAMLAILVRGHRRKFPVSEFATVPAPVRTISQHLCVLLRLAVLLHRGRSQKCAPGVILAAQGNTLTLSFPADWAAEHPLTVTELQLESGRLAEAGFELRT